jgi:tight adherence protein B
VSRRPEPFAAAQLPDAVRAVARALAAGLPLPVACERAADALPAAPATALRRSGRLLANGCPAGEAFAWTADVEGGHLLAGAIDLHAELGGDLVATLALMAGALADRERLRGEVEIATAQARFAARVVPLVPLVALAVTAALDPVAMRPLIATRLGLGILILAGTLDLAGTGILRRMARGLDP